MCFALSVRSSVRRDPAPALYVSLPRGAPAYPEVLGLMEWADEESPEIRAGDRLIRMGAADLRGVGPLGLFARLAGAVRPDRTAVFQLERAGERRTGVLRVDTVTRRWPSLPVSFAFAFFAVLLVVRAPWSPMARAFFYSMMCTAFALAYSFAGEPALVYSSAVVFLLSVSLWGPLAVRAVQSMVEPPAWNGRLARRAPWAFVILGPINLAADYGGPLSGQVAVPLRDLTMVAILATVMLLGQRAYAAADPARRRQLKWIVLGLCWAAIPKLVAGVASAAAPRLEWLWTLSLLPAMVCPLFLLIGIVHANLFDIDRLMSASTFYTVVGVVVGAVGLVLVPRIDALAAHAVDLPRWAVQALLALALASAIVPASRRLRPRVDRMFFPDRDRLARGIDRLLADISRCESPDELVRWVGEEIDALLRPQSCVIYARRGPAYSPVFVRGRTMPADVEADGPWIAAIAEPRQSLDSGPWMRSQLTPALSARQGDAQDLRHAAVLLPVYRDDALALILVLGKSRSGDVYTQTHLAFLAAVRDKMSAALHRFDRARMTAIGVEMARMMHDLKSPLSIAKGYTQLLSRARTRAEEEKLGRVVLQQFDRMRRMSADVLSFAKGDSDLLVRKVNVGEFLEQLREQLEPELRRRGVDLVIEPELDGVAYFDESQMFRAVSNLARNAAEAMPYGGTFRVSCRLTDGRVVLECGDDGPGLPREMEGRLFTAFATAGKAEGTGLGLGTVKKVVESHGGSIAVRSRPHEGTVFRIELPLRR